jgi:hypothetical protein
MEVYLQAKDLNVWRVTNEGIRNGTKKEKQFDVEGPIRRTREGGVNGSRQKFFSKEMETPTR